MLPEPPSLHGHRDKWEGVLLVGDSSAQWERRHYKCLFKIRTVCSPPPSFIIITHEKWGSGKTAANGDRKDHNFKKRACER